MTLWWIGDILFIFVILPVVALVLHRLLRPAMEIGGYADDACASVVLFPPHIADAVGELARTQQLVSAVRPELERYSRALERLV